MRIVSHPDPGPPHLGPFHHRSTILSALGLPLPHGFSFYEPETSELLKGLVLDRDENIHIMITSLGDVGCYNKAILFIYVNLFDFWVFVGCLIICGFMFRNHEFSGPISNEP
ncbi:hypothetical protein DVH24_012277 [Malus domestica]|uniref:Uncharacterized protein n=1 Tax=Malus domestica TaxID=3750 RepID=A0A498HUN6_MALDO|nr:hypothetical protein DVH24_012277 [Malus domestica]